MNPRCTDIQCLMRRGLCLMMLIVAIQMADGKGDLHFSEPKMQKVLHGVIQQQLVAFRANDYAAAYEFADVGIKEQFSPNEFEEMVKGAFAAIALSSSAAFGLTFDNGDEAVVDVRVTGATQRATAYQYLLRRSGSHWLVAGVALNRHELIEA